jgi:hypothetical protein
MRCKGQSVVYIKAGSIVEKLISNDQERKTYKVGMAGFPPNRQKINIKKEHVGYYHHVLLIGQNTKERNEWTTNRGKRNGGKIRNHKK